MAGDRRAYEQALSDASNYAWEKMWDQAIIAYQRALAEFPNDVVALSGLGPALVESGRLGEAMDVLLRAAKADTEEPLLPEQLAQIQERLGRANEAGAAYLEAAERYVRQGNTGVAMSRWQDAIRVDPACVPAHVRLLQVHLAQQRVPEAMAEYVALAEIYLAESKLTQAFEICQHALQLDPENAEALAMKEKLRHAEWPSGGPPGTGLLDGSLEFLSDVDVGSTGSPIEMTRQRALSDLAEAVFDETPPQTGPLISRPLSKHEIDAFLSTGLDAQTLGNVDEAVHSYEQVLRAGVIRPAVNFNLGLLYQEKLRFEDAISQLQEAIQDPEYLLGSHFALGECYRALGRIDEALTHFIEVLKIVDLGTVKREQADDLIQLYGELAHTYAAMGEAEQAADFVTTLISFLGEKGWEDKIAQARERLDALASDGPVLSLAEMLVVPGSERVLQSIGMAQEYQKRGLHFAALEELNHAMGLAPTFLPLHWQMGETLISMGKTEQAVDKFLVIADSYKARGNFSQAVAMYERALKLSPMAVLVRAKLIDLLASHGDIDKALEHYMILGDTFYQMAQLDQAREKYNEALQLAPRGNPGRKWGVRILHRIGDIDMQRVDWRQAITVYERIRDLAPQDEKARMMLMDLYNRLQEPARALAELDGLLNSYRQSGKDQKIAAVLEQVIQDRPEDMLLRTRLIQVYMDEKNVESALEHLDALGELQIQAGRTKEAIRTIQTILQLNPPNADAYQELLRQLTSG